jgi:heat shock protein HslJ
MSSSAPRSVEHRRSRAARSCSLAALLTLSAAVSAAAETALETCDADRVEAQVLTLCLEGLAVETADELSWVQRQAEVYFGGLDALIGNQRGSRALAQAQAAFALFRELDCHLVEIDQGIGSAAADSGRACRIDHDRARIASLVALIGEAEAAEPDAEPETALTNTLFGSIWRVVEIGGEPTDAAIDITLEIDNDGAIAGSGGCNRYFGGAEILADGGLRFGEIGATRMACPDPIMTRESRYLGALGQVAAFELANDTLELHDLEGAVLIRLERRSD